ncbi:aryl-sulfate sulfotransferase [Streptomycetaceae bacterium NBC_01309]
MVAAGAAIATGGVFVAETSGAATAADPACSLGSGPWRSIGVTVPATSEAAAGALIGGVQAGGDLRATYNVSDDKGQLLYVSRALPRSGSASFRYQDRPVFTVRSDDRWQIRAADDKVVREIPDENDDVGVEHNLVPSSDGARVLLSTSETVAADLTAFGGKANDAVLQGVVREFDIATGTTLFEWKSLGASGVPLDDSRTDLAKSGDYLHLNAASYDSDGNILISATNTGSVYKLDRSTSSVAWVLGGKRNQFAVSGDATGLGRPQDVRRTPDGRLSVFDDHSAPVGARAVAYTLDEQAKTASLAQQFVPKTALPDAGTGGSQPLPNGNHLVTFSAHHLVREYTPSGAVAFEGRYQDNAVPYRVQRSDWTRLAKPGVAVTTPCWTIANDGSLGTMASLDGVTEVATWEIWTGATADGAMRKVSGTPATGQYTYLKATFDWASVWVQLRAVRADGGVVASSTPTSRGFIAEKYAALGGPNSWLGNPVGLRYTDVNRLLTQDYERGSIVDITSTGSSSRGAALSKGAMQAYRSYPVFTGTKPNELGIPWGDTRAIPGGEASEFLMGWIVDSKATGAHRMDGSFYEAWRKSAFLGFPIADQDLTCGTFNGDLRTTPAFRVRFAGGELVRSRPYETGGDFQVYGAIYTEWKRLADRCGVVGLPLSNETGTSDGVGRYNTFEGVTPERAVIYWSPSTGAREVHGGNLGLWTQLGRERGILGYPVTNETGTPVYGGRYNHFQYGSIYWTAATGSHEVHGSIRELWARYGWELSVLGYPVTNELVTPDRVGRFNHFQFGSIYWTPRTGAHEVHGSIRTAWANQGWERGRLGYPTSDEFTPRAGQRQSNFEGGYILWTAATGRTQVVHTR